MQVPGSPCPAPGPGPTISPVPLDVGGAGVSSAQEGRRWCWAPCPGGLGDSPLQQCHSPSATHHCCWWPPGLEPDILGCPGVALPPSAEGLVPSPHLGTAHLSHPFPCHCSLPGCLALAVKLYRGRSGRAGLSPGAGSEALPVSCSQPALSGCLPGWFGAFAAPEGGQRGAGRALGVLPGAGTFSRCHKVSHMCHCTHPLGGLATHCHHHGTGRTRPWGQPGCCWGCGAAGLGWQRLWRGQVPCALLTGG